MVAVAAAARAGPRDVLGTLHVHPRQHPVPRVPVAEALLRVDELGAVRQPDVVGPVSGLGDEARALLQPGGKVGAMVVADQLVDDRGPVPSHPPRLPLKLLLQGGDGHPRRADQPNHGVAQRLELLALVRLLLIRGEALVRHLDDAPHHLAVHLVLDAEDHASAALVGEEAGDDVALVARVRQLDHLGRVELPPRLAGRRI
mmetsp:Transcript_19528/g.64577  ORF Transcript_19528/g.64577 Transcript_19528/m.64577 type:complete len:201 (+) Transcript_19528:505-1107(+)